MENTQYRQKILEKMRYARGFRPWFAGGLQKNIQKESVKRKNLTFQLLYNRISNIKNSKKPGLEKLLNEYSDKDDIKETTIKMMNELENQINKTVENYLDKPEE